ncbi:MAG: copper resistance protein NlpE [Ferruginibacter sp.]|nr:copper resistance protein NlpE [Ferruginibacter sp.]
MKNTVIFLVIATGLLVSCADDKQTTTVRSSVDSSTSINSASADTHPKDQSPASDATTLMDTVPFADTLHTAENSLDVEGLYTGSLPCADCSGIKVILELKKNKKFSLREMYEGGKELHTNQTTGSWKIAGNNLTLQEEKSAGRTIQYKAGENKLTMLSADGKTMNDATATNYVLVKK